VGSAPGVAVGSAPADSVGEREGGQAPGAVVGGLLLVAATPKADRTMQMLSREARARRQVIRGPTPRGTVARRRSFENLACPSPTADGAEGIEYLDSMYPRRGYCNSLEKPLRGALGNDSAWHVAFVAGHDRLAGGV
jgi:hypothetical protein